MVLYKAIREQLNSKPKFIPFNQEFKFDQSKDWYTSLFFYNEKHLEHFKQKNSVSGITDTQTNILYFDFDSADDLEAARKDALNLAVKLVDKYNLTEDNILAFFSGKKGYAIELVLNKFIGCEEFKTAIFKLGDEFKTFDRKIFDSNRIIRAANTKHQDSGLYKIPLSLEELETNTSEEIKQLAKTTRTLKKKAIPTNFPDELFKAEKTEQPKKVITERLNIDFAHKVKGWSNCKWALLTGYTIKPHDRNEKLLCIIAQAKALNYTKEQAYQSAKEADRAGTQRYDPTGDMPLEEVSNRVDKKKLWQDVEYVYSDKWKGGTFSCKDGKHPWLTEICQSLGPNKCRHQENDNLIDVDKVFGEFFTYAKNIEENTIKTGISDLDDRLRIVVGQMVGLLGAPSSGKTSLALDILENTSRNGLLSVFYSLDMASSELFQKIAQRVTGYSDVELFDIFKNDIVKSEEIGKKVSEAYQNVKFCFDTGVSVDKIDTTIDEFESNTNKKVKLLMLDYNELLSSPHSDATAASGYNAGAIKKLTNHKGLCTISLLQPPKVVGDAGDEITSYRSIKGSSLLEQCFSTIIGIYRPGFSAENNSEDDQYMVMNILKNRLGKLFSLPFYWNGLRGKISSIDDQGRTGIKELKDRKRLEQSSNGGLGF